MARVLKILGVHGLGDHRSNEWKPSWEAAIRAAFPPVEGVSLEFAFVTYDDIFANTKLSFLEWTTAIAKLAISGVASTLRPRRGIEKTADRIQWTAGYVVAWVEDKKFQAKSRKRVLDAVRAFEPDIILAHSLGSLVTYNAFSHADAKEPVVSAILAKARYVTLGSQINNPFVIRNLTNGRVMPPNVAFWHHLYNRYDKVFTAPIILQGATNFSQIDTPFDLADDHAAENYFRDPATIENLWRPIGTQALSARTFAKASVSPALAPDQVRPVTRKALLVGINDYPDPAQRLEGCVNDVFEMSAVLQQCGFDPGAIRVCLNERATTEGILSRMGWLLQDAQAGDEIVFYYSGHGARVPQYGEHDEPDHHIETLVPWDFDWTPERFVSDNQIQFLYSQLPDDCRLIMIFDCCHSGGIHRDGGPRTRGISPPDDIRHRELRWDVETEMWVSRDFRRINEDFAPAKDEALSQEFFGRNGATYRIGRASMLRGLSSASYEALKKVDSEMARGAYLPLIIEACGEDEFSYEYRHGATSYGAFTFSLASILRKQKVISFQTLVEKTAQRLDDLRYAQHPQIIGPGHIVQQNVPFTSG